MLEANREAAEAWRARGRKALLQAGSSAAASNDLVDSLSRAVSALEKALNLFPLESLAEEVAATQRQLDVERVRRAQRKGTSKAADRPPSAAPPPPPPQTAQGGDGTGGESGSAGRAGASESSPADDEVKRVLRSNDHYAALAVERSASDADIKRAFHRTSRVVHPDKCQVPSRLPLWRFPGLPRNDPSPHASRPPASQNSLATEAFQKLQAASAATPHPPPPAAVLRRHHHHLRLLNRLQPHRPPHRRRHRPPSPRFVTQRPARSTTPDSAARAAPPPHALRTATPPPRRRRLAESVIGGARERRFTASGCEQAPRAPNPNAAAYEAERQRRAAEAKAAAEAEVRTASERHFRDTSETLPRHFRGTLRLCCERPAQPLDAARPRRLPAAAARRLLTARLLLRLPSPSLLPEGARAGGGGEAGGGGGGGGAGQQRASRWRRGAAHAQMRDTGPRNGGRLPRPHGGDIAFRHCAQSSSSAPPPPPPWPPCERRRPHPARPLLPPFRRRSAPASSSGCRSSRRSRCCASAGTGAARPALPSRRRAQRRQRPRVGAARRVRDTSLTRP